jgi:hypothetical protein
VRIWRFPLALLLALVTALGAGAQDEPDANLISPGETVEGVIDDTSFFDLWVIDAGAGDLLQIEMAAAPTLEPLLGILDPNGDLIARSVEEDSTPGATLSIDYQVPEAGSYSIVATRLGNENGTSTGSYSLTVDITPAAPERENAYQQVEFRCGDLLVTNALTVEFSDDRDQAAFYHISVYGLDDFDPIIRIVLTGQDDFTDCAGDSQGMTGNRLTLPDADPVTLSGDQPEGAAQLGISGAEQAGTVALTVGSRDGAPGRFVVVIDGLQIGTRGDLDLLRIGQGPLAAETPFYVYMIGMGEDRLDPALLRDEAAPQDSPLTVCDDAGRRDCPDVPGIDGFALAEPNRDFELRGDRFDAGALLGPGAPDLHGLFAASFRDNTTGRYALVILGELPAR